AFQPPSGSPLHRLLRTKSVVHSADDSAEQVPSPSAKLGGARSHIAVPMLSENEVIGAIIIYRQEVRPFTENRSRWSRISPTRPSSRSRIRGCSTSCASRCSSRLQRRRAQGHQPLDVRSADGARHAGRIGGTAVRSRACQHLAAERRRL